jgi:hypothetical protein
MRDGAFHRGAGVLAAHPLTRWVSALLVPFLLTAGVLLYAWPGRTAELFAWPIQPPLTAMIMGAGYLSGTYFFLRAVSAPGWESIRLGFLPIAAFAWLSAIATVLHFGRFNHQHVTFQAWLIIYAVTPLIVPGLWLLNRSRVPLQPAAGFPSIPAGTARAIAAAGALYLAAGAALFVAPELLAQIWPWQISPLTGRVLGSWFILSSLVDLSIGLDRKWEAARLPLESQLIGLFLILLGFLRALDYLDSSNPLAWMYAASLVLLFLGLAAVYGIMERRVSD